MILIYLFKDFAVNLNDILYKNTSKCMRQYFEQLLD